MLTIEPMSSTVSDYTLRVVALFCDRLTADKLLYENPSNDGIIYVSNIEGGDSFGEKDRLCDWNEIWRMGVG